MELPRRKNVRLPGFDYNTPGYYFITICTKEKQKLLCNIVGTGVLDGPKVEFTEYGEIARKHLTAMSDFYDDVKLDKYVVMPNHIHLLVQVLDKGGGPSGTPVPTDVYARGLPGRPDPANSRLSKFVGTFKRFCNRECGRNIWQYRSHDHVIRGEKDYRKIWEYIDNNPAKWLEDCFYVE